MWLSLAVIPDEGSNKVNGEESRRLSDGEGRFETPGPGFSQYNGLANLPAFMIRSENSGLYYIPQQLTTNGS